MAALERVICGGEPHRTRPDDDDAAHQNSSTICE
jgi:hypothetical protein